MPVDRRAAVQFGLLLLALPAQYFVSKYFTLNESQRDFALKNIISSAVGFKDQYFSWNSWQRWCMDLVGHVSLAASELHEQGGEQESPAIEVLNYRDQEGHFATSLEPRSPRPIEVKFRVGQVVKHKLWGYRGVIVGWDPIAKAPASWLNEMHPPDKPHWRQKPSYAVLVDTRDRPSPQQTYVAEDNIEINVSAKVMHPDMEEYFEEYDGAQYLPRPWLRARYPHD